MTPNDQKRSALQKIQRFFKWTVSLIILAGGVLYLINSGYASYAVDIFPIWPTDPKTTKLSCSYAGKDLSVNATLFGNVNNYYHWRQYSKKEGYLKNNQFAKFVYTNPKDETIKNLVHDIKMVALGNQLGDDQTLELAACFIQNIPYDNDKANIVLKDTGNTASTEQYPYQTLFANKGICTDKTYLGSAVLSELGYGTAILAFDERQHMALGLSVPDGYASFGSKYAYVEMTQISPPGLIPSEIDPNNGLPISFITALKPLSAGQDPQSLSFDTKKLISNPNLVIGMSGGKSYTRIVEVKTLEKSIGDAINSLASKKESLQKSYNNVSFWEKKQEQDYQIYMSETATVETCTPFSDSSGSYKRCVTTDAPAKIAKYATYTTSFNSYKSAADSYNKLVDDYNSTLEKVNKDIATYQGYQYN